MWNHWLHFPNGIATRAFLSFFLFKACYHTWWGIRASETLCNLLRTAQRVGDWTGLSTLCCLLGQTVFHEHRSEASNLADLLKEKSIKREVESLRYCLRASTLSGTGLGIGLGSEKGKVSEGENGKMLKVDRLLHNFPCACIRITDSQNGVHPP